MSKLAITLYGIICYCLFILVFLYIDGFLLEIIVPKSINSGEPSGFIYAIVINLVLITAFGFFHSLMSRDWFKKEWTRVIPAVAERSTYVLQASLFLILVMWFWQPMPQILWSFGGGVAWVIYGLFALGNILVLWSTFLINHFELFGLSQVWHNQINKQMPEVTFKTPSLYRIVRHPMQFGTLMVFWSTPVMTVGHFLFALSMTIYVLIGLLFEESSLQREFGEKYISYRKQVPMLIPKLSRNSWVNQRNQSE